MEGFNSRTPGGVRLVSQPVGGLTLGVSIHAPREGCDKRVRILRIQHSGFNSRTPGGVRL